MSKPEEKTDRWTSVQAYTLCVICLVVGLAGGWLMRGSQSPAAPVERVAAATGPADGSSLQPTPEQMRHMADKQAAPLMEHLKSDPGNAKLLAQIGNIYYDTQQFPVAIDYYQRVLQVVPKDASVRTDMATAFWYTGNADTAIAEFNRALSDEPNKPNALFNLGIVQWQGKMDIKAALASWQRLLNTNPTYEGKAKVLELMEQVKKHSDITAAQAGMGPQ
ncbi:MAG TPA: tetratricopeptide repeat protein [Terriglobales bacterium]|nr:tetratricopeptide repeat protein [Terriglobales bacterium]